MNNLEQLLASNKRPLFMAHMIAGYPSVDESEQVAQAFVKGGVDIIELQIPFSDPMADGPTIAVACEEALAKGATVALSMTLLSKVIALGKPVAVMSYLNPVYRYGIPQFVKAIAEAGARPVRNHARASAPEGPSGRAISNGACALIVPDCPFDSEEGQALLATCKEHDVFFIPVVSPGVPRERLEQLAKDSRGFVYCTTRQGITGATGSFAQDLYDFVKELKEIFKLPIAVGFGVKSKEDVQQLGQHADIVIAGSVFVNAAKQGQNVEQLARELTT